MDRRASAVVSILACVAAIGIGSCSATSLDTEEGLWDPGVAAQACATRSWVGDFTIRNLDDVETLSSYTVITGNLLVENSQLLDMDGFECLRSVRGDVKIRQNPTLGTLRGLDNLYRVGGDLHVTANPILPTCEVRDLANRIEASGWDGTPAINGNNDSANCH